MYYKNIMDSNCGKNKYSRMDHDIFPLVGYDLAFRDSCPEVYKKIHLFKQSVEPIRQNYLNEKWKYIFKNFDQYDALDINNDFCSDWKNNYYSISRDKILKHSK